MGRPSRLHTAALAADFDAKRLAGDIITRLQRVNQEIRAARAEGASPYALQQLSKTYYDLEDRLGRLRFSGAGGNP